MARPKAKAGDPKDAPLAVGRPRKISDPEVLQTLMEIKTTEQLSWKELAEWYTDEYDEPIHGETIRTAILRDAPMSLIPGVVSKKVKAAIDDIWEQVDMMRIIMFMVNARFTEWSQLYEKMIRASVEGAEVPEALKFTPEDQFRMDELYNGTVSFFMRALDAMKTLRQGDTAMRELGGLLIWTKPSDSGPNPAGGAPDGMTDLIQRASDTTQSMMQSIQEKHRQDGRGHYRTFAEEEDEEANIIDADSG